MVQISDTRIANMSLSHVGARESIQALSEKSTEAETARLWFEFSRRQTLEAFDWNFARKRITLTKHGEDPPDGVWAFRYVYPGDAVVARKIENPTGTVSGSTGVWVQNFSTPEFRGDAIPFEVEMNDAGAEKTILTNLDSAILVYTFDQTAANLYSPLFVEAFSWALASHIAFSLTGKLSVAANAAQNFQSIMFLAPASNANEMVESPPRDTDWVRGRI